MKKKSSLKNITKLLLGVVISSQITFPLSLSAQTTVNFEVGGVAQTPIVVPTPRESVGSAIGAGAREGLRDAAGNIVSDVTAATANSGGGGVGGACASSVISAAAISGTIAALTAVLGVTGVPSFSPDQGLAGAFDSGKNFLDFLEINCLNPAARVIYTKMLFKMNDSVLRWGTTANRGGLLNGSTFISDVGEYFNAVAEEEVGAFITTREANNPFAARNARAIIDNARNTSNNYTPDLPQEILNAACDTYNRRQAATQAAPAPTNSTGIIERATNYFRGTNSPLPTNSNQFNPRVNIGAFKYILRPQIANAQTSGGFQDVENYLNSDEFAQQVAAENRAPNPCTRRATTAAEKQAVIDEWNSGAFDVDIGGNDWLRTFTASIQSRNIPVLAAHEAQQAANRAVNRRVEDARTNASYGNGNVGDETCVRRAPVTDGDALPGDVGACLERRVNTNGAIITADTTRTRQTSTQLLENLASSGTWKDLAKSVVTNLITSFSSQLVNSATGILSFNGRSSEAGQGSFTRNLAELDRAGNSSIADIRAASSATTAYVSVVKADADSLRALVTKVQAIDTTCNQLLTIYRSRTSPLRLGLSETSNVADSHECNVDPYKQNYKDDPTAGARLASNPIYSELGGLSALRTQLAQADQVSQNAATTLRSLNSASSEYSASQDVDREIALSTRTAILLGQVPQDADINQKQAHLADIKERLTRVDIILNRLTEELRSLRAPIAQ